MLSLSQAARTLAVSTVVFLLAPAWLAPSFKKSKPTAPVSVVAPSSSPTPTPVSVAPPEVPVQFLQRRNINVAPLTISFTGTIEERFVHRVRAAAEETLYDLESLWPRKEFPPTWIILESNARPLTKEVPSQTWIPLPLLESERFEDVLNFKRELAHALIHRWIWKQAPAAFPEWLAEGLARSADGREAGFSEGLLPDDLPGFSHFPLYFVSSSFDKRLGVVAHLFVEKWIHRFGRNTVWKWVRSLPKDATVNEISKSFQSRFQVSIENWYAQSLTP